MAGCGFRGILWRLLCLFWLAAQFLISILQLLPMQSLRMLGQSGVGDEEDAANVGVAYRVKVVVLGPAGMRPLLWPIVVSALTTSSTGSSKDRQREEQSDTSVLGRRGSGASPRRMATS